MSNDNFLFFKHTHTHKNGSQQIDINHRLRYQREKNLHRKEIVLGPKGTREHWHTHTDNTKYFFGAQFQTNEQ